MKSLLFTLFAGFFTLFSPAAFPDSLELPVAGSISAYDQQGDLVFDTATSTSSLRVHWRNVNYLSQRWAYRSVIEYDLSALPEYAVIDSAVLSLNLTQYGSSAGSPGFKFLGYVGDGVLELADASAGDESIATVQVNAITPIQVDLADYLQTLVDAGESYIGINIRSEDEGQTSNTFDEEFRSDSQLLSVTYHIVSPVTIPMIPFAWSVVLLGLLGYLGMTFTLRKFRDH
jgi:hypothetical protein